MKAILLLVVAMSVHSASAADNVFAGVLSDLKSGKVTAVELRFVPYDLLTVIGITPERVDRMARPVRLGGESLDLEALIRAVEKAKAKKIEQAPEPRTGITFLSRENVALHTIYLSGRSLTGTGKQGIVNGQAVKLNGSIQSWVEPLRKKFGAQLQK